MSDLLPLAVYNLNIEPFTPVPAIDVATPVTIHITLAAVDPESLDDKKTPSTLRIIKKSPNFDEEDDSILGDFNDDELDELDSSSEETSNSSIKDKDSEKKQQNIKDKEHKKDKDDNEQDESDDKNSEDEEEEDDEFEEYVLLTLSPETQCQQSLDLVISPEEEVQFVVTGSYRISLSGNFVKHPFDAPEYDEDSEEEYDSDECDLTPDEDEMLDTLEELSDVEGKIEELVEKEESTKKRKQDPNEDKEHKNKKKNKSEEKQEKPEQKLQKKEKKVEFKKELEEGPSKKKEEKSKPKTQSLEGGIIIEDRVVGSGKIAKKGSKVGMRYIGKLKNGKVFDKNTNGKPFMFSLGRNEVIKGWDIGVAGMAVGGERRIIIPAPYAYGKQSLPGIPANSELTFDVKLVSIK